MQKNGNGKLTKRQQKLVEAMADPNVNTIGEAGRKAGYTNSPALNSVVHETLKNPKIQDAIEKRKAELAKYAGVTPDQVLGATTKIAFASIEDAVDANGNFDFKKATKTGAADIIKRISKVHTKYGINISVDFYPKDAALAKLGEYLGMQVEAKPNPMKIAIEAIQYIMRTEGKPMKEAIETILEEQKKRQTELIPIEQLKLVAKENGIIQIEGLQ